MLRLTVSDCHHRFSYDVYQFGVTRYALLVDVWSNILIFLTDKDEKLAKPQYRMNLILFENNMKHENTYNVR